MLWFGISTVESDSEVVVDQQIHGPYSNEGTLEDAINLKIEEATLEEGGLVIPIRFGLCTDDVPELVEVS